MATAPKNSATTAPTYLGLGAASVCLGMSGLAFAFLAPLGALLSVSGLICGILGWLWARPERRPGYWWSVWGTILSFVAVAANLGLINYSVFENWWVAH